MRGRAARFVPCTALGVIELLQRSGVAIKERNVVVMGDSNIVGMCAGQAAAAHLWAAALLRCWACLGCTLLCCRARAQQPSWGSPRHHLLASPAAPAARRTLAPPSPPPPPRPLAMLFRDAGAATVTVLHRTSYRELFADATSAAVGGGAGGRGVNSGAHEPRTPILPLLQSEGCCWRGHTLLCCRTPWPRSEPTSARPPRPAYPASLGR